MNINAPLPGKAIGIPFTKAANPNAALKESDMRLPFASRIPDSIRNHFVAMCGEFVGTFLFLFFALSGAQVANSVNTSSGISQADAGSNPQQLQYIALCFGFSLAVNAWVFFRISGGLFNPAVTVGMCLIGALPWFRGVLLFFTQLIGGIVAAALVSCLFPGSLNVQTSLGGGTTVVQGLFIEMFLTAQLVFTIFMLAAEKHRGTFIAPVGIGLALFIAELTGVYFTGGSLNPARSLGPAVVNTNFHSYHWIYWVGPMLGSIVAAGFYKFIKILEYETANPGQDMDHAANVNQRATLLMEAGLDEHDARAVATELAEARKIVDAGGMNGTVMANAQGRKSMEDHDPSGMYGAGFRPSDETAVQRPSAVTTGSQLGSRLNFLRQASARNVAARSDSPAMATHEELYAPLGGHVQHGDQLGGLVRPEQDARARYSRTLSSGV